MRAVDFIENNLSLLSSNIDFEGLVKDYIVENPLEDYQDEVEYIDEQLRELSYRMNIYGLSNLISPEDGNSILVINKDDKFNVKKYLHRFLSFKSLTGGESANADGSAELFEKISANAVKNFLGEGAKIQMVGEGRENLTEKRLIEIIEGLREKEGVFHNLPKQAKDDGVDFIVYKKIDNRDVGNIIILGQACVGKYYDRKKPIYERWKDEYITYAIKPPTTLLSIVYFLDTRKLRKVHSEFGNSIVFDRGRIMKYYNSNDEEINDRLINFVNQNISED